MRQMAKLESQNSLALETSILIFRISQIVPGVYTSDLLLGLTFYTGIGGSSDVHKAWNSPIYITSSH